MFNEMLLAKHFVSEIFARGYEYERIPEPELVMDTAENVREFRDGGLVQGSVAPVYLFNMLLLCGAIKPGSVVVDLGCGPANLLIELALLNPQAQFIGVDLSQEMLRFATEFRDAAGATNVEFVQTDITRIEGVAPRSADLVMSTLSMHHLPESTLLFACMREVANLVKPGGNVHLMDFGCLKRRATTDYFAKERAKGLGEFLALDYKNSLYAAYRTEDFEAARAALTGAVPATRLHRTFGVPFLMALTSLRGNPVLSVSQQRVLRRYWSQMMRAQQGDFEAIRFFFRLDGLPVPRPRSWSA